VGGKGVTAAVAVALVDDGVVSGAGGPAVYGALCNGGFAVNGALGGSAVNGALRNGGSAVNGALRNGGSSVNGALRNGGSAVNGARFVSRRSDASSPGPWRLNGKVRS